jgi:hypothetical protein
MHRSIVLIAVAILLGACASRSGPARAQAPGRDCTPAATAAEDTSPIYGQEAVNEKALALPSGRPPRAPQEILNAPRRHEARAEAVVDTSGRVEPCSIRLVSATNQAWGEAVMRWARGARYQPARVGGRPVRSRVIMGLVWEPGR